MAACSAPSAAPAPTPSAATPLAATPALQAPRRQLDGRQFPDHVLALTWDDGPDEGTLALAEYLASQNVHATFFVVREWVAGLSEEPGAGRDRFETGYGSIPVLGDLVALGHRIGNHTANHVLLANAGARVIGSQLGENQRQIDPLLTNELRIFRAPGGAWDDAASFAVDANPALASLIGPVRWDIDGKDWEGSLYCRADASDAECEVASGRRRTRPEATASRYLEQVAASRRGIVLFHDRVGDVGSDYAIRLARIVVPELERQGYVFSAPRLEFAPFRERMGDAPTAAWVASLDPSTVVLEDVDGDGRADLCGVSAGTWSCASSIERPGRGLDARPESSFVWRPGLAPRPTARATSTTLRGDLNGDGRLDACELTSDGVRCAFEGPRGALEPSIWLARSRTDAPPWLDGVLLMADANGDGRADLCSVARGGLACALSP
jgi:peptidoglycan/xylan/chitin deacetylase (PgdA/CDA1 family)